MDIVAVLWKMMENSGKVDSLKYIKCGGVQMDSIMTLEEVSEFLRVSERTVKEWVNSGELPGGKLGASWRFRRSDIEQWTERKLTPHNYVHASDDSLLPQIFLHPGRCLTFSPTSKDDAINQLIDVAMEIPGVTNRSEVADAVFTRERLMSTGLGINLAIPHARLNGIDGVYATIGVCEDGIPEYSCIDGTHVKIVVLLLIGREQHCEYLKALSQIVDLLKDEEIRNAISAAKNGDDMYKLFIQK